MVYRFIPNDPPLEKAGDRFALVFVTYFTNSTVENLLNITPRRDL